MSFFRPTPEEQMERSQRYMARQATKAERKAGRHDWYWVILFCLIAFVLWRCAM
jgi:hypothetical protein